jgi:hypothetical protein
MHLKYLDIILMSSSIFFISIVIYWLPTSIFHELGKDKAINNIQSFIKNDCNKKPNQNLSSCISILDENKKMIYKGVLIAHNLQNDRLAIMQKNEISIIQLKPDYVITRAYFYADKPNPNPSK